MSETPLLEIEDLHKSYFLDGKRIDVLRGSALKLMAGEMAALTGPSGVGKSTFLHVVGTLDDATSGTIRFEGVDVFALDEAALADFRNRAIGFVFQFHYLIPELTALENVMQPALIRRVSSDEAERNAREMLEAVGLGDRLSHRPGELSGGEQQRVALARALVLRPKLLLADEPTGNLDDQTGEGIHQLLVDLNRKFGTAAIVVTHNERLASRMPRRLRLHDGVVSEVTG